MRIIKTLSIKLHVRHFSTSKSLCSPPTAQNRFKTSRIRDCIKNNKGILLNMESSKTNLCWWDTTTTIWKRRSYLALMMHLSCMYQSSIIDVAPVQICFLDMRNHEIKIMVLLFINCRVNFYVAFYFPNIWNWVDTE